MLYSLPAPNYSTASLSEWNVTPSTHSTALGPRPKGQSNDAITPRDLQPATAALSLILKSESYLSCIGLIAALILN